MKHPCRFPFSPFFICLGALLSLLCVPFTGRMQPRAVAVFRETELESEPETPSTEIPIEEDFQWLYEQNPDTVGWIRAGENIDYAVVQSDNEFYLHHDFDGNPSHDGTLFVNEFNCLLPRDWLILIHGHHMRSGAMFGRLMDYESYDYLCSHPLLIFRTIYDSQDVFYAPIAAFNASMVETDPSWFFSTEPFVFEEMAVYDYWVSREETESCTEACSESETDSATETVDGAETVDPPEMQDEPEAPVETDGETEDIFWFEEEEWLETEEETETEMPVLEIPREELDARMTQYKADYLREILSRSIWESPLGVSTSDELLVLITCSYYQEDGRFFLFCRKLREDETPEEVAELFAQSTIPNSKNNKE